MYIQRHLRKFVNCSCDGSRNTKGLLFITKFFVDLKLILMSKNGSFLLLKALLFGFENTDTKENLSFSFLFFNLRI